MQERIVRGPRVTVADEEDPSLLFETAVVVAEPEAVVLERALGRHEVVQAGGRAGVALGEGNGRVEDRRERRGDIGSRDGVLAGARGHRLRLSHRDVHRVVDVRLRVDDRRDVRGTGRGANVELERSGEDGGDGRVKVVRLQDGSRLVYAGLVRAGVK